MCLNLSATDWPRHVVDSSAKVAVPKGNQTQYNHISMISPNNIWSYCVGKLPQWYPHLAREQTHQALDLGKKHQT